jgi:hypothetical protein
MSAWPSENLPRPIPFVPHPDKVFAYFLSPSDSEFSIVAESLRNALSAASQRLGLSSTLERAIDSRSPVIVHDEIWNWLYRAAILVFDITEENGSVMMELGVAAGWRLRAQVLVLQNRAYQRPLPFNLVVYSINTMMYIF